MTVTIEHTVELPFDFEYKKIAKEVISHTVKTEEFPYEPEVSLLLTDNETIRDLNRTYREIDRATDVLSFPMLTFGALGDFSKAKGVGEENVNPDTGEILLGDIIISVPKLLGQAEEYGHSPKREFAFLITHSMLHLLGYDHMEPEEAAIMENKQKTILDSLGITR
ncbi:MAG: rRNA maturation RNase YbeY [Lachnospiraceae bacterium]|nr:rRNA maturation RNase YbeY [Lachnospiraceae bacterium]